MVNALEQRKISKISEAPVKSELVIFDELDASRSAPRACDAVPPSQQTLRAHKRDHHHQLKLWQVGQNGGKRVADISGYLDLTKT